MSEAIAYTSTVGYYLSADAVLDAADQLLSNSPGYLLLPGQSVPHYATMTVLAGTASGNYYILFAADFLNQVNESNEMNNVTAVSC